MEITKKSDRLGEEDIGPLLIKLSIPAIIGMLIQSLYNVIDSIYIGRLSTEALSALSLSFPIQMMLIAIGVGTGVGASSLISRLLGQNRVKRASNAAEHVILITVLYGIIVGVAGFFFADDIVRLFTDDPTLRKLAYQYIRIILIGSFGVFLPAVFNYILRGEGNTVAPMVTMLIGAILNIILDPFIIFGIGFFPKLGVQGAALATVFSRFVGGIFITYILFSDKNEIQIRLKDFEFDFEIIKEIYQVGVPAMVNRILVSIAVVGVNKIVGSFNTTAIAVVGMFFRLQSFFLMPIFGLNQGYLPLVGYNYGHGNPQRMKKTIFYGSLIAFFFAFIGFLLFRIFPEPLIKLFNSDPELLRLGIPALRRISFAYLFMSLNILGSATFQAIGKGVPSLFISLLRQTVLLLPVMYFLGNTFGVDYTWFAYSIAESITLVVLVIWLSVSIKKAIYGMNKQETARKKI